MQLFVLPSPQRLLDVEKEEEQEEAPPPQRTLQALCSIPRRLAISAGLGGTPVTPQLIEVNTRIQKCFPVNTMSSPDHRSAVLRDSSTWLKGGGVYEDTRMEVCRC